MRNTALLNDLLSRVSEVGRSIVFSAREKPDVPEPSLAQLCEVLLSGRGEATGLALGRELFDRFESLDRAAKAEFFLQLANGFGVERTALDSALAAWKNDPCETSARALHFASEPRSQELIRRLNRAPGGISSLVAMRVDLLRAVREHPELSALDQDFHHLFGSWFNRGFLELRRIDWSTAAEVLEKIITYEAVHEINGWDDLRQRVAARDRRLYAFFHPALINEPLIFVEVALTDGIPDAIPPILSEKRKPLHAKEANTAVFYSISNCQTGLRGISFGNFLIKQVVEELRSEFEGLRTFVTLSPVPGLRQWVEAEVSNEDDGLMTTIEREHMAAHLAAGTIAPDTAILRRITALYFLQAKTLQSLPVDPVARFHLGNGARLEQINSEADPSERGQQNSWGVMVNYLYDLRLIEKNHEAFANDGTVICNAAVSNILNAR